MTTATRFAAAPSETELYCPACDRSFTEELQHCPLDGTRLVRISDVRDPLIGRNLDGRFLIKERLGVGGMGAVYRAWQGSVGREVAVKVIEARLKGGRLAAKRFLREAKLASRLSHANTVAVIDFGQTEDGLLYLVMELVKGRTLGDVLLEDGPFSVERMIRVGLQLCEALEAAHKLSIIHRDLKPSNIIVLDEPAGRDHIKVLDFGLAKSLVDEGSTTVTQSDAIMGTPSYIPPEAVTRMQFDERSDLYSLGVILYELLAGRLPFEASTVQAMLRQHAYERPKPLPETVPPPVADLLFALLEKEPDRRPPTASAVCEHLLALTGIPERATPLPLSRPHPFMAPPTTAAGSPTPVPVAQVPVAQVERAVSHPPGFDQTGSLPRRSRPWLVLGVAGVVLGGAAALVAGGALDSSPPAEPAAEALPDSVLPEAPPSAPPPGASQPSEPPSPSGPSPSGRSPSQPAEPTRTTGGTSAPDAGSRKAAIPQRVKLAITSEPAGAEVFVAGERIGRTPLEHELERGDKAVAIELRRVGYRTRKVWVTPNRDQPVSASLARIPRRSTGKAGGKSGGKSGKSGAPERPVIPRKPPPVFVP